MSLTDLIEHTRELIILSGPEAWKQTDYLENARRAGVPLAKAVELATTLANELAKHSDRIERFRASVIREYERGPAEHRNAPPDSRLLGSWMSDLHPLQLSEMFVRDRWIPAIVAQLPPVVLEPVVEKPVTSSPKPVVVHVPIEWIKSKPKPHTYLPPSPLQSPPVFADSSKLVPSPEPLVLKFTARPERVRRGQNVTLEWDVENLLAVTIDEVGVGLSPKSRGWVQPDKTTDYTLFDATNNALKTIRVEVVNPPVPSGLYGVLFAVFLLLVAYWSTQKINSGTTETEPVIEMPIEDPQPPKPVPPEKPTIKTHSGTTKPHPIVPKPIVPPPRTPVPKPIVIATPKPAPFTRPPYDKIGDGQGQFGERPASKDGRWGLWSDRRSNWLIQPKYEDITVFGNNRATVVTNGEEYEINPDGKRIRDQTPPGN